MTSMVLDSSVLPPSLTRILEIYKRVLGSEGKVINYRHRRACNAQRPGVIKSTNLLNSCASLQFEIQYFVDTFVYPSKTAII